MNNNNTKIIKENEQFQVYFHDNIYTFSLKGNVNEDHFILFKDRFENILKNKPICGMMFDISQLNYVSPTIMYKFSSYLSSCDDIIKQKLVATSVVVYSEFTRNLLNMVYAIRKPIRPNSIVVDKNEGYNFIRGYFKK